MTRRAIAPVSTTSGTLGKKVPTAKSLTSRTSLKSSGRLRSGPSGLASQLNEKPALAGGFLFSSPDLAELRKGLDQPQRHALEAASQKRDAGRDEEDADGLLDPAELRAQMPRGADEQADRQGREDEGQTQAKAIDGEQSRAAGDRIPAAGGRENGGQDRTDAGGPDQPAGEIN